MKTQFQKAKNYPELFELVKEMVREQMGLHRAGLMLGLSELGIEPTHLVGAFYPMGSNLIVINTTPLKRIKKSLLKPYVLGILLHEYLHSLGFTDEEEVRGLTCAILERTLGEDHTATKMAKNFDAIFNGIVPEKPQDSRIQLVEDFDKGNVSYIG